MIAFPVEFPLYLTALFALVLSIYLVRRRHVLGAMELLIFMLAVFIWSYGYAREFAAPTLAAKIFWARIEYVGIVAIPVSWLTFTILYANRRRWLSPSRRLAFVVIPLITLFLVWTNESHHLLWRQTILIDMGELRLLDIRYGPWFWIQTAFAYICLLIGALLVLQVFLSTHYPYRHQAASLLVGALFPWLSNAIYLFDLGPMPNLDLTPMAFLVTGSVTTWALMHFRLLTIVPVARHRLVEEMDDAVIVVDRLGAIADLNLSAQALLQRPAEETIGQASKRVLGAWSEITPLIDQPGEGNGELTLVNQVGRRHFDVQIASLSSPAEPDMGKFLVLRDITVLKDRQRALEVARQSADHARQDLQVANLQLAELDRIKSKFFRDISHELRTPLSNLGMYLYLFKNSSPGRKDEYLPVLQSEYARLQKVVEQILDFTQLQNVESNGDEAKVEIDLAATAKSMVIGYESQATEANLSLWFDPGTNPARVRGVERYVSTAIGYLIDNAIRYTETGTIRVSVIQADDGKEACVQVEDTGPGIGALDIPHLFESFYRGTNVEESNEEGAGLGLTLARRIVELHNGRIAVESKPGVGTQFRLWLPIAHPDGPFQASPEY